ncbi:MAG: alpha/beta fold hydrolase, partial [Candidatus Cybelea sp.]
VDTVAAFLAAVHDLHAGERTAVDIVRDGAPLRLSAVLAAAPDESDPGLVTRYGEIAVDDSLRRTLLTMPQGLASPAPAVLLVGGIGCYSVDVAKSPQDAYLHLAHDLARAGFVTMRVEKSGVGDSQGPPCRSVDFDSEVRGYAAALAALQRDPLVNPARIYLLGHSIGTIVAPRLALQNRVAGVIVLEGVARDWPEYEIRNLRRQLELDGESPAAVDRALLEKAECMQKMLYEDEAEAEIERSLPSCSVHNGIYPVSPAYVQQVGHLNVVEPWAQLGVPVLAIYGTADFETELADHQRIVAIVNAAHPGTATLTIIDAMSHGLGRAATPKAAENDDDRGVVEQYDADVSAAIVAWLRDLNR